MTTAKEVLEKLYFHGGRCSNTECPQYAFLNTYSPVIDKALRLLAAVEECECDIECPYGCGTITLSTNKLEHILKGVPQ